MRCTGIQRQLCLSLRSPPTEIVKSVAPGSVDAIVAIGGDGTMHEVLQVRRAGINYVCMPSPAPCCVHAPCRLF